MILRIESILPKEDFQTPSFRAYLLLSCLADCPLFEKSSFNLSWRGEIIVCFVKDMKCSTPPSLIDDGDTAYQINSTTKIRILFPDDADAPVSAGMAILLEDISDDVSKIKSPIMRERVPWESLPFAGYRSEVEEAQRVIESGFEIPFPVNNNADTLKMKFKRPRGLLLSGPRGTGKTLFMNSLKEYFSPWFASTHSISSDILLSRYSHIFHDFI